VVFKMELDKIHIGGCLEIMKSFPSNSIDCIITSPPYNKQNSVCHGYLKKKISYAGNLDSVPEEQYQLQQIEFLDECHRVLKEDGSLFYNHKVRFFNGRAIHPMSWILKSRLNLRQEIIWNRKKALNISGIQFWSIDERIYWLNADNLKYKKLESRHALLKSVWDISPEQGSEHPAPFPLKIPTRILYSLYGDVAKGKIVLDPYCGSGTSLLAAKLLGHHYIGIENVPDYVNLSEDRVENSSEKDSLIIEEEKKLHIVAIPYSRRKETSKRYYEKCLMNSLKSEEFIKRGLCGQMKEKL